MMYMTSSDQNAVFQFDPTTDTLIKKYDVGTSCNPNALAINPKTNQTLLGCSNTKTPMVVLWDLKTRTAITTFTDAGGCDMTVYFSKHDLWLAACANFPKGAALAIFAGSPIHWVANVSTAAGSHALAYDETNNVIYTLDQRPNNAGLMAFWLSKLPK
jgi:WD40 repeat protein